MGDIVSMIRAWPVAWQVVATLGAGVLAVVCWAIAWHHVTILLRGYSPNAGEPPTPPKPQHCDSNDNLAGVCLKPGGCKTRAECEATIEAHGPGA